MKIAVTSKNKLKIDAIRNTFLKHVDNLEVVGFDADSKVGEQPVNDQTLQGARNRILDIKNKVKDFDKIISIENGIFSKKGKWLDVAVILIYDIKSNEEIIGYSDSIEFLEEYVKKAEKIGFDKITVGQVMFEDKAISDSKDPHLSITGKKRQVFLEEALNNLIIKNKIIIC